MLQRNKRNLLTGAIASHDQHASKQRGQGRGHGSTTRGHNRGGINTARGCGGDSATTTRDHNAACIDHERCNEKQYKYCIIVTVNNH